MQWYRHVRACFVGPDFPQLLLAALTANLSAAIDERMQRLGAFCHNLPRSLEIYRRHVNPAGEDHLIRQKQELLQRWPRIEDLLNGLRATSPAEAARDTFLRRLGAHGNDGTRDYLSSIQHLPPADADLGTLWLQAVVDQILFQALGHLPVLREMANIGLQVDVNPPRQKNQDFMMPKIFGTDGIRGEANRFPMTAELAPQTGACGRHFF